MLGLFSRELIFGGACYWKEFSVTTWVWFVNKNSNSNSPLAYIWEGLLSEGYLCLRFGGLISGGFIFRRAYFWGDYFREGLFSGGLIFGRAYFWGGLIFGGAYFWEGLFLGGLLWEFYGIVIIV